MAKLLALAATLGVVASLPKGPIGPPCFANETAGELYHDIDLAGKIAVVTGSDTGIGIEIARALAMRHATVILAGRNKAKMDAAMANITSTVPGAKCVVPEAPLDLSSFAVTRTFAEGLQQYPAIDILINNAGMASTSKPMLTKDGYEMVFEIDYMNTWLLTELLLPQLRAAKGRVVQVVSKAAALACEMGAHLSCMDLKNLPPPPISGTVPVLGLPKSNYGIAKLATIRSTEDLARREAAAGTGVTAFTTHPGFVATGIPASKTWSYLACQADGREGAPCPTTPPMGALTPVFLALAPVASLSSGSFYEWCYKSTLPGPGVMVPGASQEYQEGLRNLTEKWLANYTKPISVAQELVV
jgi:NAD(P)-dependent dehydrogenase (short-subunit alcohol dehydrogenase family)